MKKIYELDGDKIKSLEDFFAVFGEMVNGKGGYFGKNMDSFDDCLFGGYGLDEQVEIEWKNHKVSSAHLGYQALVDWCEAQIRNGDYLDKEGLAYLEKTLDEARKKSGDTMFDILVGTIESVNERSDGRRNIKLTLL